MSRSQNSSLTEVTAEIDSGTYLEQTKDTVGEWLDTWLKTYALYSVKSYTYDAYERSCNIHIKPALGRIRLSALTAPQIQQFYNSLITEKELSPKTFLLRLAIDGLLDLFARLRINAGGIAGLPAPVGALADGAAALGHGAEQVFQHLGTAGAVQPDHVHPARLPASDGGNRKGSQL